MAYTSVNYSLNHLIRLLSSRDVILARKSKTSMLKLKLVFLTTFLWWTAKRCWENENLELLLLQIEVVARNAVSHVQSILLSGVEDTDKILGPWFPQVLHHIQLLKPEIEKAYIEVAKSSPPVSDTLVLVEFMNNLIDNLLRYGDSSTELIQLVTKLRFLRNLLSFVATRCTDHEKLKDLSNFAETIAIEAACLPFMHSFGQKDENSTSFIKAKLMELTLKIKPITRIYVGVLEALSPLTTETDISDPDLASFIDTLQDCLTELQDNQLPWIDSLKVNFEALHHELTFLSSFTKDPPNQFIESDKSDDPKVDPIQVLLGEMRDWSTADAHPFKHYEHLTLKGQFTCIQDLAVKMGCTVFFFFNFDEMEEHKLAEAETALVDLIEKIKHLKSEVRAPMLTLPEVNIVRIDDLGFIRNLRELLDRQAGPVNCLRRRVQVIADELDFLGCFLEKYGERRHENERLMNLAAQIITVAYSAEYVMDSLLVGDGILFYHSLCFIDVIGEMKRIRREVMVFDEKMSNVTEQKVLASTMPSRDMVLDATPKEQVESNQIDEYPFTIIEKEYSDLPDHLRQCFLYFGAFSLEEEIPVSKLIRLWAAEGFIQQTKTKSFDDVAMDYLMDLIRQGFVMVCQHSSEGLVKRCKVHDRLHKFILVKAKQENFFQLMKRYGDVSTPLGGGSNDSNIPLSLTCEHRRLFISSNWWDNISLQVSGPLVRSLVLTDRSSDFSRSHVSSLYKNFKLLRVLDLGGINVGDDFPVGLEKMILLKYLEVRGEMASIPSSIGSLQQLETLVTIGLRGEVAIPDSIWSLTNLRHLHISNRSSFGAHEYKQEMLPNLRTMSTPVLRYGKDSEEILRRLVRLEKLKCVFLESWDSLRKKNLFPKLEILEHVHSLKLLYDGEVRKTCEFNFPLNLRRLTLSGFRLPWDQISIIGELPNLEVLTLLNKAFEGSRWEVEDYQFFRLKFLKLDTLDLEDWDVSEDALSNLERLELQKCKKLEEIPYSFGDILTLKEIKVKWCNQSVENSALRVQEEQEAMGNDSLKVIIHKTDDRTATAK